MNNKTPFAIAIRISLIIFTVLSVTIGVAFAMSEYELTSKYVRIFEARRDGILSFSEPLMPPIMNQPRGRWAQDRDGMRPQMKGISPNIILIESSGSVSILGNLKTEKVSSDFILSLPKNTMIERTLEDDAYFFYRFSRLDGSTVILYEPLEFVKTLRGSYALASLIGLFFFSILLFIVSYRIAKDSLKPLEEAMEQSRSYNRYMAHELKTPIAVISSNLELAKRSKDPMSYVDSSLDELSGMKSSIEKLLFLSGKEFQLKMEKTDISKITEGLLTELSKLFGREDLVWKNDFANKIVATDPAFFRLLARNCLENIFKYSKSGEVRIISTKESIIFENPADPIDQEKLKSFFSATDSYGWKGYGIGLSIVKRIADLHKWKVVVESEEWVFRLKIIL